MFAPWKNDRGIRRALRRDHRYNYLIPRRMFAQVGLRYARRIASGARVVPLNAHRYGSYVVPQYHYEAIDPPADLHLNLAVPAGHAH